MSEWLSLEGCKTLTQHDTCLQWVKFYSQVEGNKLRVITNGLISIPVLKAEFDWLYLPLLILLMIDFFFFFTWATPKSPISAERTLYKLAQNEIFSDQVSNGPAGHGWVEVSWNPRQRQVSLWTLGPKQFTLIKPLTFEKVGPMVLTAGWGSTFCWLLLKLVTDFAYYITRFFWLYFTCSVFLLLTLRCEGEGSNHMALCRCSICISINPGPPGDVWA